MAFRLLFGGLLICILAQKALADDKWVCSFKPTFQSEPMLITYNVSGRDLTVRSSGETSHFQILENDEFGLVGILLTSKI